MPGGVAAGTRLGASAHGTSHAACPEPQVSGPEPHLSARASRGPHGRAGEQAHLRLRSARHRRPRGVAPPGTHLPSARPRVRAPGTERAGGSLPRSVASVWSPTLSRSPLYNLVSPSLTNLARVRHELSGRGALQGGEGGGADRARRSALARESRGTLPRGAVQNV